MNIEKQSFSNFPLGERKNKNIDNKNRARGIFQKISTLNSLSSNLTFKLAIALLIITILGIIATGGNVIVEEGNLNVSEDLIADTNTFYVDSINDRIGIGTTTPSYTLSFGGGSTTWIVADRRSGNLSGYNFFVRASGATNGSMNRSGGALYLDSGIATGTGSSNVYIRTATAGASGTSDNNPTVKITVDGAGNVGIGDSSPNATLTIKTGGTTIADEWTVRSDRDLKTNITKLSISNFNFNASLYKYRLRYDAPVYEPQNVTLIREVWDEELQQIITQTYVEEVQVQVGTEERYTKEHIGLMRDEVPNECTIDKGVDLYCLVALQYVKIEELEQQIVALKAEVQELKTK